AAAGAAAMRCAGARLLPERLPPRAPAARRRRPGAPPLRRARVAQPGAERVRGRRGAGGSLFSGRSRGAGPAPLRRPSGASGAGGGGRRGGSPGDAAGRPAPGAGSGGAPGRRSDFRRGGTSGALSRVGALGAPWSYFEVQREIAASRIWSGLHNFCNIVAVCFASIDRSRLEGTV